MLFNEQSKSDWEQIATYLSGEMDNEERTRFKERVNFSELNKAYFNQIKTDWEKMDNLRKKEETFDTNKAWGNLYSKFEKDGLIESKGEPKVYKLKWVLQIAAVFIFGVALTSLFYYMNTNTNPESWKLADSYNTIEIKEVKLSDGSIVYLNADSKLYYPEKFTGRTRTVEFEGDAFFDIAKNPEKPFIIKAKKAEIKVLGTSFNVNTNSGTNHVEVLVATGKVRLSEISKEKSISIEPGFIGTLNKGNLSQKPNSDINYMSWKTKYFNFENVKLGEAIEILNRAYHANIQCNNKIILEKNLISEFQNKNLEKIIEIISNVYDLKFIKQENGYLLMPE